MGEDALADQAGNAAEEDAGGDQPSEIRAVTNVARFAIRRGGRRGRRGSGSGSWRFVMGSDFGTSPANRFRGKYSGVAEAVVAICRSRRVRMAEQNIGA
jgi:hypothetical protein